MINRLAGEIIGMIMEYLDDRWENPNNKLKLEYPSTLHACSLVKLEWRSLAQRVLHRKLRVHYCNLAHQRRCYGPSLGSYAGGLGLFPRELSIEHINIACTKLSEDLYALSKYCGERITRLNLYNTSFASFSNFLELLKCFPHLKRLDVRDCSWKDTSLGFWDGCAGHEDCQCSCPRAPISLQQVFVDLGEETVPLPLAQWLIHARVTTLQSLAWVFKFSLMDVSAPYTTEALHVLGPHLSYVTLDVDVSEEWSDGKCSNYLSEFLLFTITFSLS
ncbi:hypothetical protein BDY19DRAFT_211631 [Irpex rosettiformis]|uniref:Uncharacterized protein n=1 Tax=Irpex rosettiformis TaxID=378272 RepID=A0ACB8U1K5_9APHY|nr:hypothetical protein BDY19DRAFT_211631 [Irpex rosettiformis]